MAARKGTTPKLKITLKKHGKPMDREQMQKVLKKASRSEVGFVALNAPFKSA
jgi:hypothetical protein